AFSPSNLADPRVADLAGRVSVDVDPRYAGEGPRIRGARVRVTLRGGRVLDDRTDEAKWGRSAPATDEELRERSRLLIGARPSPGPDPLEASESTRLRGWVTGVPHAPDTAGD
nr:MmgE/PrpD family protein [Chloroflexota bacterium]